MPRNIKVIGVGRGVVESIKFLKQHSFLYCLYYSTKNILSYQDHATILFVIINTIQH